MVPGADISFVPFASGTVVKLAFLTSPRNFGLALFGSLVADNTYFGISGGIIQDVFRILFDWDVIHDMALIAEVFRSLFAAKTSSHFYFALNYKFCFNQIIFFPCINKKNT